MKTIFPRLAAATLAAACIVSSVGCYAYPPAYHGAATQQDAKGAYVPQEPVPARQPVYVGVDPGWAIAGVAAAGILGYALGGHHGYHHYYGPGYYGHASYGRGYGAGYYRRAPYGRGYYTSGYPR